MGRAFEYRRAAKEKRWDKMSKVFPRLAKSITMAAKDGGGDPDMNPKLRAAIQNAKAENMPKDNIENAIKRALGKDADQIQEVHYEGKGPHGALLLVECATDNNTRTVANIKFYFNRNGGESLNKGSLDFMFTRKSVIEFKKTDEMDLEEVELELIDGGLEDMEVEGDNVTLYAPFTSFGDLNKAVEKLGIDTTKAAVKYIPNSPVSFTEEQLEDIERLIDKIEEDEDVQAVYTNID